MIKKNVIIELSHLLLIMISSFLLRKYYLVDLQLTSLLASRSLNLCSMILINSGCGGKKHIIIGLESMGGPMAPLFLCNL